MTLANRFLLFLHTGYYIERFRWGKVKPGANKPKFKKEAFAREREHILEIFKIQVDDIILPWVADGVQCTGGFLCLSSWAFASNWKQLALAYFIYQIPLLYILKSISTVLPGFRKRNYIDTVG